MKKKKGDRTIMKKRLLISMLVGMLWSLRVYAAQFVWTGAGDGSDWHDGFNWNVGAVPIAGEPVVITNGASVWLTNSTAALRSLTLENATLTMANWDTVIEADTVTVDAGGVITLPPAFTDTEPSNRIHIVCGQLYLAEGGALDADEKGYAHGPRSSPPSRSYGPGGGAYSHTGDWGASGAGHGGDGGAAHITRNAAYAFVGIGTAYGDPVNPEAPGSAGGSSNTADGGNGGGAIRVAATAQIRIEGLISANGGGGGPTGAPE